MPWSPRMTVTLPPSPGTVTSPSVCGKGRRTQVTASTATTPSTTTSSAATASATRRARMTRDTLRDYPHTRDGKDVTGRAHGFACSRHVHVAQPHAGTARRVGRPAHLGGRGPALGPVGAALTPALPGHRAGARGVRAAARPVRLGGAHPGARLLGARPDPDRGRPLHAVGGHPPVGRPRRRPGHPGGPGVGGRGRGGRAVRPAHGLEHGTVG